MRKEISSIPRRPRQRHGEHVRHGVCDRDALIDALRIALQRVVAGSERCRGCGRGNVNRLPPPGADFPDVVRGNAGGGERCGGGFSDAEGRAVERIASAYRHFLRLDRTASAQANELIERRRRSLCGKCWMRRKVHALLSASVRSAAGASFFRATIWRPMQPSIATIIKGSSASWKLPVSSRITPIE